MKTTNKISITLITAMFFAGCSLDEYNPSGGPTLTEHISTPAGYENLINACYFPLTRSWTGGGEDYVMFQTECGTDLWTCPKGDGWIKELFYYDGLNGATAHLNEGWQASYEAINDCNAAIHYADQAGYASADERDAKAAEAHFLRAFFNLFLVEQFGGVYLPKEETIGPKTTIERSSVADFYNLIFEDCKFAIRHLPAKQTEIGRATQAAAYHLYAKACLQRAGYDDVSNKNELYTEAKNAAEAIVLHLGDYGLALYDSPDKVFLASNNKNNTEAVWVATHSNSTSLNPRGTNYWNRVFKQFGALDADGEIGVKQDLNGYVRCERRIMPTKYLLNLYGDKDTRYDAYFREEYEVTNPAGYMWTEGDCGRYGKDKATFEGKVKLNQGEIAKRFTRQNLTNPETEKYACFDIDLMYNADGTTIFNNVQYGYVALKKYEAPGMYAGALNKSYTYADDLLFRVADTYLLAAEACYRLGGANTATAVTYFNVIRNRACANHDGSLNIAASDINDDFILEERARELCGEYTRFMDLKRMGKATFERYVKMNPDIVAHNKFNADIHILRPIPEKSELNYQTNPQDFQNPGY